MPQIKFVYEYGEGDRTDFILLPKSDERDPELVAQEKVDMFNKNVKTTTGQPRKLISAEISSYQEHSHEWKQVNKGDNNIPQKCSVCGATGINFGGFSYEVTPDTGFTRYCKKPEYKMSFK